MTKWEYKNIDISSYHNYSEKDLNQLGLEGWELVSTLTENGYADHLIFKRPIQ